MKLRERLLILAAEQASRTDLSILKEGSHSVTQNFSEIGRISGGRTEIFALVSGLNIILENGRVKRKCNQIVKKFVTELKQQYVNLFAVIFAAIALEFRGMRTSPSQADAPATGRGSFPCLLFPRLTAHVLTLSQDWGFDDRPDQAMILHARS